ncbi:MAG: HPr(Ser) kinase/phosphatase [Treponemataceae bacterium]
MAEKQFTVLDLLDLDLKDRNALHLRCIAGRKGLTRSIKSTELNRAGLELAGEFDFFAHERIQLFGRGEFGYMQKREKNKDFTAVKKFFEYDIPCCIFTHGLTPPQFFVEEAEKVQCAVLQTSLQSNDFALRLLRVVSNIYAPKKILHGVLVEVYGLGILLMGCSGVGKSETALELIERGHRLVADDIVEIRCINGNTIMGQGANRIIGHHMEIRGLGIINIAQIYGVGAIRDQNEVQLVVRLEEWDNNKVYDRIGTQELTIDMLGLHIPLLEIPVRPGRNVPIIIETAAMNERLKSMGYFSAAEFNQNILKWIETDAAQTAYYGTEDIY